MAGPHSSSSAGGAAAASVLYGGDRRIVLGSAIGDSQTSQSVYGLAAPKSRGYYSNGYVGELRVHSGQRIQIPIEYVKGVGGQNTGQIIARITTDILTLDPKPQFCIVYTGTNAGTNDLADYGTAIKTLSEAGILPVLLAIQGRSSPTNPVRQHQNDVNARLRSAALGNPAMLTLMGLGPQHAFVFVDPSRFMTDYGSATGEPVSGVLSDGLHFAAPGAFYVGRELANVLGPLYGLYPIPLGGDVNDAYVAGTLGDPSTAPYGNLLPSTLGVMYGTGGTVSADTSAGSTLTNNGLAASLGYRRWSGNSTGTVTLSKVAKADGIATGTRQQIDIAISALAGTAPQALDNYRFTATIPTGHLAINDYVCAECEVEILTAPTRLRSIELTVDVNSGGAVDGKQSGTNLPAIAHKRILRTPPYKVDATGAKSVYIEIYMDASAAGGAASIAIDRLQARKCGPLG